MRFVCVVNLAGFAFSSAPRRGPYTIGRARAVAPGVSHPNEARGGCGLQGGMKSRALLSMCFVSGPICTLPSMLQLVCSQTSFFCHVAIASYQPVQPLSDFEGWGTRKQTPSDPHQVPGARATARVETEMRPVAYGSAAGSWGPSPYLHVDVHRVREMLRRPFDGDPNGVPPPFPSSLMPPSLLF